MDMEEYKTIRQEMLLRFRWTTELFVFSVVSTGALLSWVFVKSSSTETNPFLLICVGLGIVSYIFYSYLNLLQQNYDRGSYLAVFHEGGEKGLKWHTVNRLRNELIGKKSNWGRDGKRGGFLLIILVIANILIPLLLLRDNLAMDWYLLLIIVVIALLLWIGFTACGLFKTGEYMRKSWKKWRQIKEKLEQDPNLLEDTIKKCN